MIFSIYDLVPQFYSMLHFLTISGYSLRVINHYYQELLNHSSAVCEVHVDAWVYVCM